MPAKRLALLLGLLATAACGQGSLYPAFDPEAARFDPRLLGMWWNAEGTETVVVTRSDSAAYGLIYTDEDGKAARFLARLGRVGDAAALDVEPYTENPSTPHEYQNLLLALHVTFFVDSIGTEIRLKPLRPSALDSFLIAEPNAVAHLELDGKTVLSAPTPELGRFLAGYARRPDVFDRPLVWVRDPSRSAGRD